MTEHLLSTPRIPLFLKILSIPEMPPDLQEMLECHYPLMLQSSTLEKSIDKGKTPKGEPSQDPLEQVTNQMAVLSVPGMCESSWGTGDTVLIDICHCFRGSSIPDKMPHDPTDEASHWCGSIGCIDDCHLLLRVSRGYF